MLTLGLDADRCLAWAYGGPWGQVLPESGAPTRGHAVTVASCCRVP